MCKLVPYSVAAAAHLVTHEYEGVREALDAEADGAMPHVAPAGLLYGVEVGVDHAVQVPRHHLGHLSGHGDGTRGVNTRGRSRCELMGCSTKSSVTVERGTLHSSPAIPSCAWSRVPPPHEHVSSLGTPQMAKAERAS